MSKSFGSCAGVTLTAPVPNAGSTNASAMTGRSRPDDRKTHSPAHHVAVALVVRVHRHGGVAEHCLRPRRRDRDATLSLRKRVPEVIQPARGRSVYHLQIGQRRPASGTPADEIRATIDESFVMQRHEHPSHRQRQRLVERESLARPVDRRPEFSHLTRDGAVTLLDPLPDALFKGRAAEIVPRLALRGELFLDDVLRGDARVVGAGQPQHVKPAHTLPAGHDVWQGLVQGVAYVQRAGDVGWRQHHAEPRPARCGGCAERAQGFPVGVPFGIDRGVIKSGGKRAHCRLIVSGASGCLLTAGVRQRVAGDYFAPVLIRSISSRTSRSATSETISAVVSRTMESVIRATTRCTTSSTIASDNGVSAVSEPAGASRGGGAPCSTARYVAKAWASTEPAAYCGGAAALAGPGTGDARDGLARSPADRRSARRLGQRRLRNR